jgi:hypothetical protein
VLTHFIYLSILIFSGFFGYIVQYGNNYSLRTSARFLCFFVLFVPAALRYGIGTDYFSYVNTYSNEFKDTLITEPGFLFIGKLCYRIGFSSFVFMAIISGITYGLLCFGVPRNSFFTVIIYYILSTNYFSSYNTTRQMLAVSLLLCGLIKIFNKKIIKGFIFFIAASSIHYASIIAFPIILLSFLNINNTGRIVFSILIMVVLYITDLTIIIIFMASLISPKLALYANLLGNAKWTSGLTLLIYGIPSVLIFVNSKKIAKYTNGNFILNINIFWMMLLVFVYLIPAFARVQLAMSFILLFLTRYLYGKQIKLRKIYHIVLMLLFFALFMRAIEVNRYGTATNGINPYVTIFNK